MEFSVTEQTLRATHQPHEEFVTRIISTGNGFITLARNERPKYTERSDRPFSVALPSLVDEPITFLNGDGETVMFGNHAGGVAIVRPRE